MYPSKAMARLVEELKKLPGVGVRTAERLAYHMLKASKEEVFALADAMRELRERVRPCSVCFNVTEADPCAICTDSSRDRGVICVVETPRDLLALERLHTFKGSYHVLTGALAPLEGVGPQDLTIAALSHRVQKDGVREVILATNPNVEGDQTALYLAEILRPMGVRISRLARGLPSGSALEFASQAILEEALLGRRHIDG